MGGYIRKYKLRVKPVLALSLFILVFVLMLGSILMIGTITHYKGDFIRFTYGILPFIDAVLLFQYFVNLPTYSSRIINKFAGSVFVSYLITENSNINFYLWTKLFNASNISNSIYIILFGLVVSVTLLIVTVFIDQIRLFMFNRLHIEQRVFKLFDSIISYSRS